MYEKADKLVYDYNKIHNRFTQFINKGKKANFSLYSERLLNFKDKGLKIYES